MFNLILYLCFVSMASHVAMEKFVDFPNIPKGFTVKTVQRTWEEAKTLCQSEGAILASPIDIDIFNKMHSIINATSSMFYIGAKATDCLGNYVSIEGVPFEKMTVFTFKEIDPVNGDCLAMSSDGTVYSVECLTRLPYICYDQHLKKTNCGPKEKGYTYDKTTGHCYKIHPAKLWNDALTTCADEGAHLAIINNQVEAQSINSMEGFSSNWMFIGLRQTGSGDWKTICGQPVEQLYNTWVLGHKPVSDLHCGTLKKGGYLDDVNCAASVMFICQKEPIA